MKRILVLLALLTALIVGAVAATGDAQDPAPVRPHRVYSALTPVPAGGFKALAAYCPTGQVPTGGGFQVFDTENFVVSGSLPLLNGWAVTLHVRDAARVYAWAVCG
jgi:hypothetical protein